MTSRDIYKRNLSSLMAAHGLRHQRDLAHHLQIPFTSVNAWFVKGSKPRSEHLTALCKFFNISPADLFDEDFDIAAFMQPVIDGSQILQVMNNNSELFHLDTSDADLMDIVGSVIYIYNKGSEEYKNELYGAVGRLKNKLLKWDKGSDGDSDAGRFQAGQKEDKRESA